jgi:pimeloyl-ACP methyl ester carboxylesterase
MPYLNTNNLDLFYDVHGAGEPMLLLHGFGGTGQSDWRNQIPVFSQSFRVVAPDLRGHGRTDHPETITGPEFFALATTDVVALLRALKLGPVHVCGFSMGASIASWVCLTAPSMVRSLILVSGAARINRDIAPGLFELWEGLADPDGVDPGWAAVLARLHGEERWRMLLRNYSAAVIARVEGDEEIAYSRTGEISCPTLVIQGSRDSLNPPLLSEELHACIPGSELTMMESGHWVHGYQPEQFNARVLEFLERHFQGRVAAERERELNR